jgi:hypothetical protein
MVHLRVLVIRPMGSSIHQQSTKINCPLMQSIRSQINNETNKCPRRDLNLGPSWLKERALPTELSTTDNFKVFLFRKKSNNLKWGWNLLTENESMLKQLVKKEVQQQNENCFLFLWPIVSSEVKWIFCNTLQQSNRKICRKKLPKEEVVTRCFHYLAILAQDIINNFIFNVEETKYTSSKLNNCKLHRELWCGSG